MRLQGCVVVNDGFVELLQVRNLKKLGVKFHSFIYRLFLGLQEDDCTAIKNSPVLVFSEDVGEFLAEQIIPTVELRFGVC